MQVLLIPDLYEPATHWEALKQQLEKASLYTNIYSYTPPRNEDISDIVEDLKRNLVDETILVGSGIGGRIAVQVAAQQPHQLAGILLLSTPAMKAPGVRSFLLRVFLFITTPIRILIPYYARKKLENLYKRLYPGDPKKMLYRKIIADEQDAFLTKIADPLYLLWGSDDSRVPPAVANVISEKLDYADVAHDMQIVAGGDHRLHQLQPDLVATVIVAMTTH